MNVIARTAAAVVSAGLLGASVVPAQATTDLYKNCTNLHTKYPHGVGRSNAHDHTTGKPVTTFTHSTSVYNTAIRSNSRLDADHDGIACEAR